VTAATDSHVDRSEWDRWAREADVSLRKSPRE